MIVFDCSVCRTKLSAQPTQAGSWVLCPNCRTKLQVPAPAAVAVASETYDIVDEPPQQPKPAAPRAPAPPRAPIPGARSQTATGKRYGFNCGYCSSRLEATESMAAQDGQCPTCGNSITIPIQDRYGRLIDPKTRQIIKQDPHPVHAYAAAGDRAPAIIRQDDGKQIIRCARCNAASPISANNCKACGMPFTMEGTTLETAGSSNGFAVAGLVLGIVGLPACMTIVPSLLSVILGGIGYSQIIKSGAERGGKGMAITGIVLGSIGLCCGLYYNFFR